MFSRNVKTISEVNNYYEMDPFQKDNAAFKSLQLTRKYHVNVMNELNEKYGTNNKGDKLWMSQLFMVHGQLAFMVMILLHPDLIGTASMTKNQLEDYVYSMRVVFYCLGYQDRFNICEGDVEDVIELCKMLKEHSYQYAFKIPGGIELSKMIAHAFGTRYNSLLMHLKPTFTNEIDVKLESVLDYLNLYSVKTFVYLLKFSFLRRPMNFIFKLMSKLIIKYEKRISIILDYFYPEKIGFKMEYVDLFNQM